MTNAFTASGLLGGYLDDVEIAAEFDATAFARRMLRFEKAWTEALRRAGAATEAGASEALDRIAGMERGGWPAGPGAAGRRDGVPVPALVAALREGLSADAARAVHTGATSQDVLDTATVLTALAVLGILDRQLQGVVEAIAALERRFGADPLTARTRMQAALPATAALRLAAWRRPLEDHLARLGPLRSELAVAQIGGPAGLRDMPSGVAEDVATALGLTLGPVWHTDRSRILGFGHWLALVAGSLGKIGADVLLMAQGGEIAFPGGGGSSAMPHKRNPVGAEAAVALARYVGGLQGVLAGSMLHEQERSGAAWALEWLTLPSMAEATGAALGHVANLAHAVERIGAEREGTRGGENPTRSH